MPVRNRKPRPSRNDNGFFITGVDAEDYDVTKVNRSKGRTAKKALAIEDNRLELAPPRPPANFLSLPNSRPALELKDILTKPEKPDGGIDELRGMIARTRAKLDKQMGTLDGFRSQVNDIKHGKFLKNVNDQGSNSVSGAATGSRSSVPALPPSRINSSSSVTALANSCFHRPVDLAPIEDRRVGPRKPRFLKEDSASLSGVVVWVAPLAKSIVRLVLQPACDLVDFQGLLYFDVCKFAFSSMSARVDVESMDDTKPKKKHKKQTAGRKAKKKRDKNGKVERHNPKAFTYSGGRNRVQKKVQYVADKRAKALKAERIDKNPPVPPPLVIVVQGPPGSGKSTLIRSLVRHYTKHNLTKCEGPITLVSGKSRRLTFIECSNDVRQMIDLAKIADLVLLTVDASYGFEMETFEFLNILQTHGFPRVIGVLPHLDKFTEIKTQRAVKRKMKQRFWTEIHDGAKLFYLSGLQYGRYNKTEILNLSRFISVAKFHPTNWRAAHPHMLALRWEDVTPGQLGDVETRDVNFYGYLAGARLREGMQVHIPGVGDFPVSSVEEYDDPCPCPELIDTDKNSKTSEHSTKGRQKNAPLRSLKDTHKLLYAPACNAGNVLMDADAMYINLPEYKTSFTKAEDRLKNDLSDDDSDVDGSGSDAEREPMDSGNLPEAVSMVRTLQDATNALQNSVQSASMQVVKGTQMLQNDFVPHKRRPVPEGVFQNGSLTEQLIFDDGDDDEFDQDQDPRITGKTSSDDEAEDSNSIDGDDEQEIDTNRVECAKAKFNVNSSLASLVYSHCDSILKRDAASVEQDRKAKKLQLFDDEPSDELDDDQAHISLPPSGSNQQPLGQLFHGKNDFESSRVRLLTNVDPMELFAYDATTKKFLIPTREQMKQYWDEAKLEDLKSKFFITGGWDSADEEEKIATPAENEECNSDDDSTVAENDSKWTHINCEEAQDAEGNDAEQSKIKSSNNVNGIPKLDGSFGIATFVRVSIRGIPAECVHEFDPKKPIIVGGLLPGEATCGFIQLRLKKHRWAPKILKSNDAMLVSAGWRRFQTMPIYAL
eukprot:gene580-950_t